MFLLPVSAFRGIQYGIVSLVAVIAASGILPNALLAPTGANPQVLGVSTTETSVITTISTQDKDFFPAGISAKAVLAYNPNTRAVYAQKQIDTPLAIASITKLMTALLAIESGPSDTKVTITSRGTTDVRPRLALTVGEQVYLKDLIKSMLVGSVNDGALSLGDYLTRINNRPVAEQMNIRAAELGMQNSHFANSTGFDSDQNYATARDLSRLVDKLRELPILGEVNQLTKYRFTSISGTTFTATATNKLIGAKNPELRAIKTGFTEDAGGAMITEIALPDQPIVLIVLGSNQREKDTKTLEQYTMAQLGQRP